MKRISKTTTYWFLKPTNDVYTEYHYIRIKTVGFDDIAWSIGYENNVGLVSFVGGELSDQLKVDLESEFQEKMNSEFRIEKFLK